MYLSPPEGPLSDGDVTPAGGAIKTMTLDIDPIGGGGGGAGVRWGAPRVLLGEDDGDNIPKVFQHSNKSKNK
jgi:hypothetical protein